jgi:flagellar hook-associated protein 1 FlgK
MGVSVEGVEQMRSKQLDQAFRNEYKTSGYYDVVTNAYEQIERTLQEIDKGADGNGYGLRYGISELFTALQDFSTNPNSQAQATIVTSAMDNFCKILNNRYDSLEQLRTEFKNEFSTEVDETNSTIRKIAELNKKIENSMLANGYKDTMYVPNELVDERNLLIDELSKKGAVKVFQETGNKPGEKLGGVTIEFNGRKIITGEEYDKLVMSTMKDGEFENVRLNWNSTGDPAITGEGELKGYLEMLNGKGPNPVNATDNQRRGFYYYTEKLNAVAETLTSVYNNIIPKTDTSTTPPTDLRDANGNIEYRQLFGASMGDGSVSGDVDKVNAGNIAISRQISSNPSYLIYDGQSTNNEKILQMIAAISTDYHDIDSYSDDFTGTFEDMVSSFNVTLGNDLAYSTDKLETSLGVTEEILNTRDSIMGVNETEETTSMLVYNRSFQAAARMLNTMDGLIDIIVNQLGR